MIFIKHSNLHRLSTFDNPPIISGQLTSQSYGNLVKVTSKGIRFVTIQQKYFSGRIGRNVKTCQRYESPMNQTASQPAVIQASKKQNIPSTELWNYSMQFYLISVWVARSHSNLFYSNVLPLNELVPFSWLLMHNIRVELRKWRSRAHFSYWFDVHIPSFRLHPPCNRDISRKSRSKVQNNMSSRS